MVTTVAYQSDIFFGGVLVKYENNKSPDRKWAKAIYAS
jgi:hypothetical protein